MNKNRATNIPTIDRNPQFFIRRSEIEFDQRARYVEFVCSIWNEGRFGPDLTEPMILEDWTARPEPAAAEVYDPCLDGPNCLPAAISPSSALNISLGRAADQKTEAAFRTAKQTELSAATANDSNTTAGTSSNQGRGSP